MRPTRPFHSFALTGLAVLPLLLAACSGAMGYQPTPTFPTILQSPSAARQPFPFPSPQATLTTITTPSQAKTRLAGAIDPVNAAQLVELARWGKGNILNMAASDDGRTLAFATRRGLSLYDAVSFKEIRTIEIAGGIAKVVFSPDGQTLAAAGWDSKISLYRAGDWKQTMVLDGGDIGQPLALTFLTDGKTLILQTSAELSVVWDTSTGKLARRWMTTGASAMAASTDGLFLVTSNYQGNLYIWTASDGRSQGRMFHDSDVECLKFAPDSRLLAACYGDFSISLWNAMDGKLQFSLQGHMDRIADAAFSPDGTLLASASWDQTIRLWDSASGKLVRILVGFNGRAQQVMFSGDGKEVIGLAEDGILRAWRTSNGALLTSNSDFIPLGRAVFSPDSTQIVTGSEDGAWRVWQASDGVLLQSKPAAHPGGISDLHFSPDGASLVTGGMDGSIRVWSLAGASLQAELTGSESWIGSLDVSPDGRLVAGSSTGSIVRLWNLADGILKQSIDTGGDKVLKVAFSADGASLWTGGLDGSLKQWRVSDGSLQSTYQQSGPSISSLSSPQDGSWLAAAGDDRRINLWQLNGGETFRMIDGINNQGVSSLAFSPDGQLIFAAFWDKTLRVYTVPGGALVKQWDLPAAVRVVNVSPAGTRLALSLDDGTVRIWGIK